MHESILGISLPFMTKQITSLLVYFAVFFPFVAAVISYITGRKSKKARDIIVLASTVIEVISVIPLLFADLGTETIAIPSVLGLGLSFSVNGFSIIYLLVTVIMWLSTALFSGEYFAHYKNRNRYYFFYLLTLGAVCGIFLAEDFFTLFIFFEIMSFTSYTWVAHDETKGALRAAETYLAVSIIGGLSILMGLFLLYSETGTLHLSEITAALQNVSDGKILAAGLCMLAGFGAKAGMIPLHIWLPKAHPVAPAPSSALLSGVLTKTGVFGILALTAKVFSGNEIWGNIIFWLGTATMVLGALLALCSVDLKRTLACSSMSQIGFILIGAGLYGLSAGHVKVALVGAVMHMINHSMFKLLLFIVAGTVYMNLHKLNLNEIRGFGKNKPFLAVLFAIGGLGISGMPFLSGYVSKTLLHEGIIEYAGELTSPLAFNIAEYVFLFAGGLTFAYMIKLFVAIFIENGDGQTEKKKYVGIKSRISMMIPAIVIVLAGILPNGYLGTLNSVLTSAFGGHEGETHMAVFSSEAFISAGISLTIGAVVYFFIVRTVLMKKDESGVKKYINIIPSWCDLEDSVYRPILSVIIKVVTFVCTIINVSTDTVVLFFRKTFFRQANPPSELNANERASYAIGSFMDKVYTIMHKGNEERKKTFAEFVVQLRTVNFAANRMIVRSFSFGLLMTCLGICAAIVYILFKIFG